MKIAYFELGFTSYPEDYSISPKGYGGGPVFARWAKELLNDKDNEFWIFAPEQSLANIKSDERRDRCIIIKPASLEALRAKQPISAHIPDIHTFDIICHHHTSEWINKGALNIPVVHWSGFGTGGAGHPKNDYTLLFAPDAKSDFGEKFKKVKIGKPVPKNFQESPKEDFIFQCTRHDDLMGSAEVARECLENGIKAYFAGPIIKGYNLMDFIDGKTTFYLGLLDEESKMDWTRRATLTTYLHNWDAPFNQSAIESLSVGTPILANNRGFFKYLLKNGVNGFVFNGHNFKASFNAAKKLRQRDCWESAREYSVEEMIASFKKAFEEIVIETRSKMPAIAKTQTPPPIISEDGSKHFLECIIACVGCANVLDKTLRFNIQQFDHFIVVTSHEDTKTREVCQKYGATCVVTNAFHHNGAKFDRAKAHEVAIKYLKYGQFVLLLDADILLHAGFRQYLSSLRFNIDKMYGAERIHVTKPIHLKLMTEGKLCGPIGPNEWGFGYFQLFHMRSKFLRGKQTIFKSFPSKKEPFGLDDFWFREQFGIGHVFVDGIWNWDPHGQSKLHLPCYHLGVPAEQSQLTGLKPT